MKNLIFKQNKDWNMNKTIQVLVAFHKNYFNINSADFYPIHAGAETSNIDLKIQGDNTGDNISDQNPYYSELTGLYWAWKNLDVDYYGSMHYRRYLLAPRSIHENILLSFKKFEKRIKNHFKQRVYSHDLVQKIEKEETAQKKIQAFKSYLNHNYTQWDIILPEPIIFGESLWEQYSRYHSESDLIEVMNIIKNKYPDYLDSFQTVMHSNEFYAYNIFILRKDIFHQYMEWLFSICFELEKKIEINNRSHYQARVYAFLAERLFSVFLHHLKAKNTKLKIKILPIMFLDWN